MMRWFRRGRHRRGKHSITVADLAGHWTDTGWNFSGGRAEWRGDKVTRVAP